MSSTSYQFLSRLESAVRQHESWRTGECLNMLASENYSSPQTRGMLVTDFANRYTAPDKFYRGARFMDEVQALAEEVARKVYNAKFADVRPTSGHAADMALLLTLVDRGDTMVSVGIESGGYPGILAGPQGGLILGNNEETFKRVASRIHPGIIDNVHWNRVAGLAVTLMEMLQFGKAYAQAVVKNSQALGKGLADRGVAVRGSSHGYSKSHQVLLECDKGKGALYGKRLEESNIIIDNGGRVGTSEATRMGMGPAEMDEIADLIATSIQGKKPSDFSKKKVKSLIKDFKTPRYVLKSATER